MCWPMWVQHYKRLLSRTIGHVFIIFLRRSYFASPSLFSSTKRKSFWSCRSPPPFSNISDASHAQSWIPGTVTALCFWGHLMCVFTHCFKRSPTRERRNLKQVNEWTNQEEGDIVFSKLSSSLQEADEHRLCGDEPVPHAANPEPPLLPPGEGPPRADRAGGNQTDLPPGAGDHSGQAELRQRWRGG